MGVQSCVEVLSKGKAFEELSVFQLKYGLADWRSSSTIVSKWRVGENEKLAATDREDTEACSRR